MRVNRTFLCALLWAMFVFLSVDRAYADAPQDMYYTNNFPNHYEDSRQGSCGYVQATSWWQGAHPGVVLTATYTTNSGWYCGWGSNNGNAADFIYTKKYCWDGTAPNTSLPLAQQCKTKQVTCPPRMVLPAGSPPDPAYCVVVQCPGTDIRLNDLSCVPPPLPCKESQTDGGIDYATGKRICSDPPRTCPNFTVLTPDGRCGPTQEKPPCPLGYYRPPGAEFCMKDTTKDTPNNTQPTPENDPCPFGTYNISTDSSWPNCTSNPPDTTTKTTTTTNPDGSTTKTDTTTTTKTNPDGTKTTTTTTGTTTTQGGGCTQNCTTTTTTNTQQTDGKDKPPDDLCKLHPTLNICQNSTVSGTCENITCNGDAIQCRVLVEEAKRNCQAEKDLQELKADSNYGLGKNIMSGQDPQANNLPRSDKAGEVAIGTISGSGWLGGGACFPDTTFTVQGRTVTLSFVKACDPLIAFRYIIMTVALIFSFRMVSGVIFRE